MILKKIIFGLTLTVFLSCKSQTPQNLTFETLRTNLVDFLLKKNEVNNERADKLKKGEYTFNLRGANNNLSSGLLKNGMYAFSSFGSHSKAYFVLVENNSYIILDISTREGLDVSIRNLLDFCERNKYCVDITNDYVSRLIGVYYNINNNRESRFNRRTDINCEKGIKDTNDLP